MLLYLLVVVDFIEKSQRNQTSYKTAAAHRRRGLKILHRPIRIFICRYQRVCERYGYSNYCLPRKICTNWIVNFTVRNLVVMDILST